MATKAKTKAIRDAEHKSNRSQASARRTEAPGGDAFEILEQDHRDVEEWLDEYDELSRKSGRKEQLAKKICMALKVHTQIEQEIFYPRARKAANDDDLIDEAIVEHATVKNLISEIEKMKFGEEFYDAKMRVLGEMVKRHIREEEEELFPELGSSKMDLHAVGKELAERKKELMSKNQTRA